ncbi:Protein of unknown function [Pyronema omphalodes CBS 100304]|uniref:Uncharacterized protein n=1 Tax=Pyronema omphalodes (strain CBS 100304) TaxID=1076935 RepID=U4LPM9_PYROM|nr:Protein of unknown function [Pyronema omphalodes CBS 100304]
MSLSYQSPYREAIQSGRFLGSHWSWRPKEWFHHVYFLFGIGFGAPYCDTVDWCRNSL